MDMIKFTNTLKIATILAVGLNLPVLSEAAQTNSKTLMVTQTVGNAPSYSTQFKVYTSTVGFTPQSGMSMNINGAVEVDTSGISKLNTIASVDSSGNPLDQATLLSNANYVFSAAAPILGAQLTTYMNKYGIGTGILNYTQQVYVKNNTNPFYLTFQEAVDSSGRPRYGAAQLIPTKPAYDYGIYTAKAVAQTLPSSFAYPNAGTVQYQSVDQQMNPLSAMSTVNVNGAFDAPVASPTATTYPAGCKVDSSTGLVGCDPDYGLKCLINHASDPQCPATPINGFTDFIGVINANGASGGYLDYVRSLTPVYTQSTDASGNLVQTAQVSVSVDTRTWTNGSVSCKPDFTNYPTSSNYIVAVANGGTDMPAQICSINGVDHLFAPTNNSVLGSLVFYLNLSFSITVFYNNQNAFWTLVNSGLQPGQEFNLPFTYTETSFNNYNFVQFGPNYQATAIFTSNSYDSNGDFFMYISGEKLIGLTGSGGTFQNTGRVGYQVQSSVDRYFVYPDGTYALINHITTQQVAPTQNYDWTVTLPQGATSQSYTNMIIDPFKGQAIYDWTNDTVNHLPASTYIYVAPLVVSN
jgi:hypothetical protein